MTALELRVDAALKSAVCLKPDYVRYEKGNIVEVFCKVCGLTIRKMIPSDIGQEVTRRGNQTIIRERLVLASLPNYREVLISCDDGSAHVTCVCQDCAPKLNDPAVREECYACDLGQWSKEGVVATSLISRNPEAVESVAEVIQ